MRGAERSLVTVGRSFTVAKGFVPLWGTGRREGGRDPLSVRLGRAARQLAKRLLLAARLFQVTCYPLASCPLGLTVERALGGAVPRT